ncbi:MAG: hypothetical protein A2Y73_04110 [Chloroflexi bacterium RBG_13_56_8]|nr:MAG: hypothetical protein A2Y73_04110 [Chloroflexi bacterium RBG_13_56_8]
MSSIGSTLQRAFSRAGLAVWRVVRRHPVTTAMGVLAFLALGSAYRIWREGFPRALGLLPGLAIYLVLFIAIYLARRKIQQLLEGGLTKEGASSMGKAVAREVARESVNRGEAFLQEGVTQAKGALSALAQDVRGGWEHHIEGKPPAAFPAQQMRVAPRCRACGRVVRGGARYCDKCGAALPLRCAQCGRPLRSEAQFCDNCGASVEPVA